MERKSGLADRDVLCLFDVDGTLTPPREVTDHDGLFDYNHNT